MKDQIFYHAPSARTGDVIPKYIEGKYHLEILIGKLQRAEVSIIYFC